jgi:hypothetical protein
MIPSVCRLSFVLRILKRSSARRAAVFASLLPLFRNDSSFLRTLLNFTPKKCRPEVSLQLRNVKAYGTSFLVALLFVGGYETL